MNPNSANQIWSKWSFHVRPEIRVGLPFEDVRSNVARFFRKAFGSASIMHIQQEPDGYLIEVITEGQPVHDPNFQRYIERSCAIFFQYGFGWNTETEMTAKLLAGSRQDGTPADQLLMVPRTEQTTAVWGVQHGERTL